MSRIIAILAALLISSPAMAKPSFGWATGGLYTPEAQSGYLFTGPRVITQPAEKAFLIGGLSYEVSPGSGRHGFVGSVLGEYVVAPKVGLDLFPTLIQEWDSEKSLSWYWGMGVGVSLFLEEGKTLSPWTCVSGPLKTPGHTWSMGLTLTQAL